MRRILHPFHFQTCNSSREKWENWKIIKFLCPFTWLHLVEETQDEGTKWKVSLSFYIHENEMTHKCNEILSLLPLFLSLFQERNGFIFVYEGKPLMCWGSLSSFNRMNLILNFWVEKYFCSRKLLNHKNFPMEFTNLSWEFIESINLCWNIIAINFPLLLCSKIVYKIS